MMTQRELEIGDGAGAPGGRPATVMERLARMLAEASEPSRRARIRDALLEGDFSVLFEDRSADG